MGRKIFVSYKYGDSDVENLGSKTDATVRDYVDVLEDLLDDHIYKGEENDEDLSCLSDDVIWEKLKQRIYDSTLTIVFISPNMKEPNQTDRNQWIPWEISYSLKETRRTDSSGQKVTSKTNAMIAIVLPDSNGNYDYYLECMNCCSSTCTLHHTDKLFKILRKNKFNKKDGSKYECNHGDTIWKGECSYIAAVKWSDFKSNIDKYIEKAYARQADMDSYELKKELD